MPFYTTDKAAINNRVAGLATSLEATLLRIQQFKAWLDTLTDPQLISAYGYVPGDIDVLRSAVGDLDQLRILFQGGANLSVAKDFRTFSKQLFPFGSI